MGDEVRPVGPVQRRDERRERDRRAAERRAASASRDLVPTDFPAQPAEPPARPAPKAGADASAAAFAAQMIGQTGQRRGLKGGPPVLDAARSTYLGTAYSGVAERRPKPGKASDTDV
ncbi:hypothetical protein N0B44_31785 [Roseibacterium beibuensis]|uniref:hypothetical protein n=1 Tax=[Roseibacterium] beibuensis TaxID=1193142 RepID=UPI00217E4178|nr:hypothetical protein [Roseibacterium beibuensis]MCS6627495.1 hypothetical protein [Roseibacterium beibuensis]